MEAFEVPNDGIVTFRIVANSCSSSVNSGGILHFSCGILTAIPSNDQIEIAMSADSRIIDDEIKRLVLDKPELLEIYPNPTSSYFKVTSNQESKIGELSIFNSNGSLVFNKVVNNQYIEINSTEWKHGVYFIRCTIGVESITRKLVIIGNFEED